MSVTVVVCTRDRQDELRLTLESIARQQADVAWDVLVVDNGSRDGTADLVRRRAGDFPVSLRLETEPQPGLSHARNRALATAAGDVLLYLDDDVTCRDGWLAAHARAFRDSGVHGSGGRILPQLPADTPGWFRELLPLEIGGPTARYDFGDAPCAVGRSAGRPTPCGANMGLRRERALELGGFRVDLGWGRQMIPGEETDLFRRLQGQGDRLVYVPDATVEHRIGAGRVARDYFVRWYRGHGRATVRLDPPHHGLERAGRVAAEARRVAAWWLRGLVRSPVRSGRAFGLALRKRSKAEGKLLELLGL